MFSSQDKLFMERAIELAKESFDDGEVPVGAVIVQNEMIIGEGKNKVIFENDVSFIPRWKKIYLPPQSKKIF